MDTNPTFSVIVNFKTTKTTSGGTLIQIELMLDKLRMYGPAELILVETPAATARFTCCMRPSRGQPFSVRVVGSISGYNNALRTGVAGVERIDHLHARRRPDLSPRQYPEHGRNHDPEQVRHCHRLAVSSVGERAPAARAGAVMSNSSIAFTARFTGTNLYCYNLLFPRLPARMADAAQSIATDMRPPPNC